MVILFTVILLTISIIGIYKNYRKRNWESEFFDMNDQYHIVKRACNAMQKEKEQKRRTNTCKNS